MTVSAYRRNPLLIGSTVLTEIKQQGGHRIRQSQSPPNRVNGSHIRELDMFDIGYDAVAIPS